MRYPLTRRQLLQGTVAGVATAAAPGVKGVALAATTAKPGANPIAHSTTQPDEDVGPYEDSVLPPGVRSRFVANVNGLRMHVLEAGSKAQARAGVLLLHGFPELAYSWRRLMPALAEAGYHVMAPDLRGYGRTDGTGVGYDEDLRPFRMLNEDTGHALARSRRSVTARSTSPATTSDRSSRRGARWRGRTCFARSC